MSDGDASEALLARLREWLEQTRSETEWLRGAAEDAALSPPRVAVGLETLIEEFTALRQEVKLQTKGARGLEEQTQSLLAGLQQAITEFQSVEVGEEQAARAALKPLVTALAELDEALERGRKQTERAVERLRGPALADLIEQLERLHANRGWWARRRNAAHHRQVLELVRTAGDRGSTHPLLDALIDGYRLVQRRLAQTMSAVELIRIRTVGKMLDPETMVVVEVVEPETMQAGKRPFDGMVVDEVRCGYFWGDELLKCAEVRVARVRETMDENSGLQSE